MLPSTDRWLRLEELFHEALAIPGGERELWLAANVPSELTAELSALLAAHQASEHTAEHRVVSDSRQQRYGPYVIDSKIGEGGMGTVFLAHRADGQFEQRVAIKVIRQSSPLGPMADRFRLERQILANLSHPSIAKLLDGGISDDGSLFLVMEYVDGVRIDRNCEERKLDQRARIEQFLKVCAAVDYAHRNLVVHRDLKPDNILVQGDGTPSLLDFGTAKLLTPLDEASETEMTRAGFRAFTPQYASPEQVLGQAVTTASDIYSLGVLLYQLLTGRPPYKLVSLSTAELVAVVCQQEPTRPNLNSDLDAIINKSLRKDAQARYRSVAEMADDLRAYLNGQTVAAHKGSLQYRASKFVLRHKALAAVIALLFVTIALGIGGVLHESSVARSRYQDLRKLTSSLLFELNDAIRDLPGSTAAQKLLVTRVVDHLDKMANESASDNLVQADLAEAYRKLGNLLGNPYEQNLGDFDGGLAALRKALAITEKLLQQTPSDRAIRRANAMVHQSIGDLLFGSARTTEAVAHTRRAIAIFDQLAAQSGSTADDISEASAAHETLGDQLGQIGTASIGDRQSSLHEYKTSIQFLQRASALDTTHVRSRRAQAVLGMKVGNLELESDAEKALASYQGALRSFEALPEAVRNRIESQRLHAFLIRKVGTAMEALERWDAAIAQYEQSRQIEERFLKIDPEDGRAQFMMATVLNNLAMALEGKDDKQAALARSEEVLVLLRKLLAKNPGNALWRGHQLDVQLRMAELLRANGSHAEADRITLSVMTPARELADRDGASELDLERAATLCATAEPASQRNPVQALAYVQRLKKLVPVPNPRLRWIYGAVYRSAGKLQEAREEVGKGLAQCASARCQGRHLRLLQEEEKKLR